MLNFEHSPFDSARRLDLSQSYRHGHCFGHFHRIPLSSSIALRQATGKSSIGSEQWHLNTPHVITREQRGRVLHYQVCHGESQSTFELAHAITTATAIATAESHEQHWLYLPGALVQAAREARVIRLQGEQLRLHRLRQVAYWLEDILQHGYDLGHHVATPCAYMPLVGGPVRDATRAFAVLARLEIQGLRPLQALSFVRLHHGRLLEGAGPLVVGFPTQSVQRQLPDVAHNDWLIWERQRMVQLKRQLQSLLDT